MSKYCNVPLVLKYAGLKKTTNEILLFFSFFLSSTNESRSLDSMSPVLFIGDLVTHDFTWQASVKKSE